MSALSEGTESGAEFDAREFRDTLGHYASGITIISAMGEDGPVGFTCQSFYSVSTEPPLVSFSVMRSSATYPDVRASGGFAVNVLAHDQHALSNQFARKGDDRWEGVAWSATPEGRPVIDDTVMWLDCDLWAEHEAGDHLIVIGRVNRMSAPSWHRQDPLLYFKGAYRYLRELQD
jgi:3-hydroxy-9,10-secoandrosta-1,3,5(10)-triene-9,17-dione monooxygenase reductase component